MKYLLTILLVLSIIHSSVAQNKTNEAGQPYGLHIKEYDNSSDSIYHADEDKTAKTVGNWRIIENNKHPIIKDTSIFYFGSTKRAPERDCGFRDVVYNGGRYTQYYSNKRGSTISVRNGIWYSLDSSDKLLSEEYLVDGIQLWRKEYNSNGELGKETINNKGGFSTTLYYYKSRVILKDSTGGKAVYYPNDNLFISNAILTTKVNYSRYEKDTIQILISAKENDTIIKITPPNEQLNVYSNDFKPLSFPVYINPKDSILLNVVYIPSDTEPEIHNDIEINTSKDSYYLFVHANAFHIDRSSFSSSSDTLGKSKKIKISKRKYKYLRIDRSNTAYSLNIDYKGKMVYEYQPERYEPIKWQLYIDLKKYKPGDYTVYYFTCDELFSTTFTITK